MSADNGIYVALFEDNFYRITGDVQAIENIDYFSKGSEERKEELKSYFGESKLYKTKEEALIDAHKLEEEVQNDPDGLGYLEYGVSFIPGIYENW
jgi:hypothetical protein